MNATKTITLHSHEALVAELTERLAAAPTGSPKAMLYADALTDAADHGRDEVNIGGTLIFRVQTLTDSQRA